MIISNNEHNADLNVISISLNISIIIKVELYYGYIFLNVLSPPLYLGTMRDSLS